MVNVNPREFCRSVTEVSLPFSQNVAAGAQRIADALLQNESVETRFLAPVFEDVECFLNFLMLAEAEVTPPKLKTALDSYRHRLLNLTQQVLSALQNQEWDRMPGLLAALGAGFREYETLEPALRFELEL